MRAQGGYMSKHKADKLSKVAAKKANKLGTMPQSPDMGSNNKNQYR